jgi:dihydrofolate synthase/folylpolyglutamate synthase
MATDYSSTLSYLYARLPMFQRIGAAAYKANLDNTLAICELLGHPERAFKSVHIAGTNGKGSSSHMLAAVLQSRGLKVGLYTSPHLKDFRERIRINGKMIPKPYIVRFVSKHKRAFEKIEPSFFEWTVGLAFDYFAHEKVDIAIIETGLGGRLDSTNVIQPLFSIITNISADHMNLLGNTLPKLAFEKAGIIKARTPVIIGETQNNVKAVFKRLAKIRKSPILFADEHFKAIPVKKAGTQTSQLLNISGEGKIFLKNVACGLKGLYQQKNIATVFQALVLLNESGFDLSEKHIRQGIAEVAEMTGLRGRWEMIQAKPLTIADTGHNEAGIKEVLKQIRRTPHRKLLFVIGLVSDKDISKILSLFPKKADYYFCKASVPRALDADTLQAMAKRKGLKGKPYSTVKKALRAAQKKAGKGDLVFVGGSTFTVADAL